MTILRVTKEIRSDKNKGIAITHDHDGIPFGIRHVS